MVFLKAGIFRLVSLGGISFVFPVPTSDFVPESDSDLVSASSDEPEEVTVAEAVLGLFAKDGASNPRNKRQQLNWKLENKC